MPMHTVYVTYEDAQELIPVFQWYVDNAPMRDARADARIILKELHNVPDQDFGPMPGKQIVFEKESLWQFFKDVEKQVR